MDPVVVRKKKARSLSGDGSRNRRGPTGKEKTYKLKYASGLLRC